MRFRPNVSTPSSARRRWKRSPPAWSRLPKEIPSCIWPGKVPRQPRAARVPRCAAMTRLTITALLLAGILGTGLIACGDDDEGASGATSTTISGPQRSVKDVNIAEPETSRRSRRSPCRTASPRRAWSRRTSSRAPAPPRSRRHDQGELRRPRLVDGPGVRLELGSRGDDRRRARRRQRHPRLGQRARRREEGHPPGARHPARSGLRRAGPAARHRPERDARLRHRRHEVTPKSRMTGSAAAVPGWRRQAGAGAVEPVIG